MSDAPDPLEAELLGLRPLEVSPGLRRRVAESLGDVTSAKPRRLLWFALAGGAAAAACLAAILLRWEGGRGVDSQPTIVLTGPAPPGELLESAPTLLAYQRALARSPEELDARLNRDALVASQSSSEVMRFGAFTRSDTVLHALLGED